MIGSLKNLSQRLDSSIQRNLLANKKQYIPLQSDLFIVEFPKSGVTWLNTIISNIEIITSSELSNLSDCKKSITFGNLESFVSDIQVGYPSDYYSAIFGGKLLKSHTKMTRDIHRLIYLYRHPVNVMKSYYNMCRGYQTISNEMTFSEFIREPKLGVDAWKEHIKSWLFDSSVSQRICFVSYENLVDNTNVHIEKVYNYFGVYLPKNIIDEAIKISNLDNMKIMETQFIESDLRYKVRYDNKYRFVGGKKESNFDSYEESEKYIRLQCVEELRWLGYES